MTVEWRDVPGDDRYEVSRDGQVRRKAFELKPHALPKTGHLYVTLGGRRREYVHRLVAMAFLAGDASRPHVNHKNGKPSDNRVENIEWVTPGENIAHGYRSNGRVHYSCVRVAAVDADGVVVDTFQSMTKAAAAFAVTCGAIRSAVGRGGTCCGLYWVRA